MRDKTGFFPLFLDLRGKRILFVGGGNIAARRILQMNRFCEGIEVVSPELTEELRPLAETGELCWKQQTYAPEVLTGADIVLICTDQEALNHEIWAQCRKLGILVNNCSNHRECDFYFPGIAAKEEVTVAVNAGGHAHRKAARLRRAIGELLEKDEWNEE